MYNHQEIKRLVNRAIDNLSYNEEAEKLIEPVRYILSMGGKRLRPVLSLMSCNLFNDRIDDAIIPSVGLEVFHNFTLVHDDIMDQSPMRRNFPTVHSKWNVNQAVLSGDVMAFIANDCLLHSNPASLYKVFRVFNEAAIEVCAGQQLDIDFEKLVTVSDDEYIKMIEFKTAVLIAASAKIGAILGGAEDKDSELMYEFGRNLGLAFQIQDDLLDIYGDTKKFGKSHGGDIVSNKKTLLLIKAFETASGGQLTKLKELFTLKEIDPETKINSVIELYNQLNIRSIVENIAYSYINNAFELLEKVEVIRERKAELTLLTSSLIGRER